MEPIISPWVVYCLNMCTGIKFILLIIGLIGGVCYILYELDKWNGKPKTSIITLFVFISLLGMIMPDEEVAIKMLIAQNITYERVEMVEGTVQSIYEDVISLIDGYEDQNVD